MTESSTEDYIIEKLQQFHKGTLTDEVISKLEEAFKDDLTIAEATAYAGIGESTYYNYVELSTEFREKMARAKQYVAIVAKKNIARAVVENKSVQDSWKYLERRQRDIYNPDKNNPLISNEGEEVVIILGDKNN